MPDPVHIATEGAIWGAIKAHGLLRETVIVSDDAGQFAVGQHALCWVHAERLVHKLDAFTDRSGRPGVLRDLIWSFYADLKAYRREPNRRAGPSCGPASTASSGAVPASSPWTACSALHANKAELLLVLDRPEIPLHTNGSENDIRARSPAARSAAARAAILAATAAMPSWALPRPAPSSASASGTISAAGSASQASASFHPCPTWSEVAASPPDRPQVLPLLHPCVRGAKPVAALRIALPR